MGPHSSHSGICQNPQIASPGLIIYSVLICCYFLYENRVPDRHWGLLSLLAGHKLPVLLFTVQNFGHKGEALSNLFCSSTIHVKENPFLHWWF
ncbi:hypothetical protein XELAEV_18038651mg [Xenopus laevis]|uniref:Uncharacterized protein n=1 Tax=Xenopus laevis TaxID=8355 RepID=A0A974C786_XENLA|nr:hypothetical protein XELAEV_18038651mg [Xenopus laevis]